MNSINRATAFTEWLADLKDLKARAKVLTRIRQGGEGNFGDISLSAMAFQKCVFISAQAIVFTMPVRDEPFISC